MKRGWLYLGVAIASIAQFVIEALWCKVLFTRHYGNSPILHPDTAAVVFNYLGGVAFAFAFGLLYLHVPKEKRSSKSGATLGTILGLLIGLFHAFNEISAFNISGMSVPLEILKTTLLGTTCGFIIAVAELKLNRRRPAKSPGQE